MSYFFSPKNDKFLILHWGILVESTVWCVQIFVQKGVWVLPILYLHAHKLSSVRIGGQKLT